MMKEADDDDGEDDDDNSWSPLRVTSQHHLVAMVFVIVVGINIIILTVLINTDIAILVANILMITGVYCSIWHHHACSPLPQSSLSSLS